VREARGKGGMNQSGSGQAGSIGNRPLDRTEHDTGLRRESGQQELRAEWADLLFCKIDHADDLATDELLGRVQLGDLRAGLAFSVSGPKSTQTL
jgi:hypothetical protein